VLLGTNATGVPNDLVDSANDCSEIPMVGQGASLSVALAGSLLLYRLAALI
jgi:tRNA (guanosine-2'-O-)-methyltransferase